MSIWTTFDGVFFISIATIVSGVFGLAVKHCLKSKCEEFKLCYGLVDIKRRVDLEVTEEIKMMEMGIRDKDSPIIHQPNKNNLESKDYI